MFVQNPIPLTANQIDAAASKMRGQAIARGDSEEVADSQAAATRANLEGLTKGYQEKSTVVVTKVGEMLRADLFKGEAKGQPQSINFYDGKNAINFGDFGNLTTGIVSRDENEVFLDSLHGKAASLFLARSAILSLFSPEITQLQADEKFILLEKTVPTPGSDLVSTWSLKLDKSTLLPVSFEQLLGKKVRRSYKASDWQILPGGLQVPKRVDLTIDAVSLTYVLESYSMGDGVETSRALLPPGATLRDARFGDSKSVKYVAKGGKLLSDDQVLQLLGERLKHEAANPAAQKPEHTSLAMFAGFILIGAGGIMWRKGARAH